MLKLAQQIIAYLKPAVNGMLLMLLSIACLLAFLWGIMCIVRAVLGLADLVS